jgi:ribonucleoside-diphosphate reductase alpha chain
MFVNVGRAGSDVAARAEALGRLTSFPLRLPTTLSQDERLRQVATQRRGSTTQRRSSGGSRSAGDGVAGVDGYSTQSTSMSPTTPPCHDATPVATTATAHPPITVSAGALPLD